MNTSSNYQFNLPQATDTVDISKLSDNWDKIDTQLKSVQNTAENTESFAGQRSNLQTDSTDTLVSAINEVNSHADTNENNLNTEIERAKKEEFALSSSIEAETKRAKEAEETNATAISTEKSRAEGAESTLTNNLNSEITRAKKAESDNASAISAEATRAKAAEKANADDISALKTQSSSHGTNVTNLTKRVAANESAISTLNGTGDGSVSKQVSDAVAKIVSDAPEDFDTLKEISDWISTHAEDASAMNTQIETNKSDISKLSDKLDELGTSAYDDTEIKESITEINNKISNVDNTSDADKPISTATQTALQKKQDTIDDLATIRSNASEAKSASETNAEAIASINENELLDGIETYYALRRTGKQYSVQVPRFASNQSSTCTKIGINANLNYSPSTDTDAGTDDYENIPLFQWVHVVYKRYSDGAPYPIAIEGTKEYDDLLATGACDVGAMQMSFYVGFDQSNSAYDVITISDLPFDGAVAWSECRRANGDVLPWCIGSSYYSSLGDDGLLHSLPNRAPERFQSYNNMCENYPKKGEGYQGAGCERITFSYIFMTIKGGTKNIQNLFEGCTDYSFQYTCAVAESNVKRVIMTTSNGANFYVGASVQIGVSNSNNDRGQATTYSVTSNAVVLSKESVTISGTEYTAINLDLDSAITTTTSTLVSSIHWRSGSTDKVIGHRDGSYVSNTDGKHPCRIQGREYMIGGWTVASDTMFYLTSTGRDVYVYPKGTAHVQNSNANAVKAGTIPLTSDCWAGDIDFDPTTGVYWFATKGSSSSLGIGDYYTGGTSTGVLREYLIGGGLGAGSHSGFSLLAGYRLGNAYWFCLAAD